jgi:hypothetical protein
MNRRRAMQIAGLGALAATVSVPAANAQPSETDYRFEDNFDGPAGSAPDFSKWEPAYERETMEDPTFWELPGNVGQYRDDRRNLFLDGKSNLVLRAAKDGDTYYSGKVFGRYRGGINTTWEARVKFNCLTPGCWPAWYLNGGEHVSHTIAPDSAWHRWRVQWTEAGMSFWLDHTEGAAPYFTVTPDSLPNYQFNTPGYTLFPILGLAVAGSGGGDPSGGTYPAEMLVDWVRVW